jgi:hypothetical protein
MSNRDASNVTVGRIVPPEWMTDGVYFYSNISSEEFMIAKKL